MDQNDQNLGKEVGRKMKEGLKFRNNARYVPRADITQEHAIHNVNLAKTLIEFLEKELKKI